MPKGNAAERKRQKRLMKKRQKDQIRQKSRSTTVSSENSIQHQMLGEFGNVSNFIKNIQHLAGLFTTEESLKEIRFDSKSLYEKLELTDPTTNAAMIDIYSNDDFTYYSENYEEFWKETRAAILPDFVTDELAENLDKTFKILLQKKRGFKKDYRAILAGSLLAKSHIVALKESPVEENNLWELIFNATIKSNKVELPEPVEKTEAASDSDSANPDAPAATEPESPEILPENDTETAPKSVDPEPANDANGEEAPPPSDTQGEK